MEVTLENINSSSARDDTMRESHSKSVCLMELRGCYKHTTLQTPSLETNWRTSGNIHLLQNANGIQYSLVGWTHQMCCNQWSNIRQMSKVWRIDISYVPSRGTNICQECTQYNNLPYFSFLFFARPSYKRRRV